MRLTLHYEKGFTVMREPSDPGGGAVLYRYPFEKLRMSADDGIRNLYLDFGGPEGEMVRLIQNQGVLFRCYRGMLCFPNCLLLLGKQNKRAQSEIHGG